MVIRDLSHCLAFFILSFNYFIDEITKYTILKEGYGQLCVVTWSTWSILEGFERSNFSSKHQGRRSVLVTQKYRFAQGWSLNNMVLSKI